jgi:hypothetical protein
MLDKEIFATQIGELAAYHKKDISSFVQRIWYKHLSQSLSTAQFEQAIELAFVKCNFMPTPEQLVEFGGSGQKTKILSQWERIDQGRKAFSAAPCDVKGYDQLMEAMNLDPVAFKALKVLGGIVALSKLNDQDIRWTRERFVEYYQLWDSQRNQLELEAEAFEAIKASQETPALPPASVASIPDNLKQQIEGLESKRPMPQLVPVLNSDGTPATAEEYQAIAQAVIRRWSQNGELEEKQLEEMAF